ncbi:uncharacterized protein LOC123294788 [Chrysoperla carnea]|uniref:uncharacterized protein LOC123294788 n=1 Tax=Chrysoperla carnea TaxID=189513 RepID=UPI001D078792|nr:uncharacterized protein LOC123294788 [Chrysoperla carnea]
MILRRNSIISSIHTLLVLCIYLQSIKFADTRAVVFTEERASRLIREIYPEEVTVKQAKANYCLVGDVVYATGEAVGSSDPCEQCECRGPGVECSPMKCPPPNPGCRALHRPDICCPSYQCECTFGNRTYANGERLEETPNGPCKVCYCRGGEIQCNDVGCYTRDDCEPVQVPGQCCPKYDNCPPRDHVSSSTELIPSSSSSETFELDESNAGKIPSDEIINSSYESAQSGQITSFEDASAVQSAEIQESSTKSIIKELPIESRPKITIKEVIAPPKREINVANTYNENSDNSPKIKDDVEKVRTEAEIKNEYPENESYEHPASVIRVGNDVIIYEGGQIKPGHDLSSTPASFINVIGAEGLQIGGVDDVQNEHFHNFGSSTEEPKISSSESTYKTPTTENLAYLKETDEMAKLNTDVIFKDSQEKVLPTSITSVKKQLIDGIIEDQITSEGPTRIPISFEGYSSTSSVEDDLLLESSMKQEREHVDEVSNNNNPIQHEKSKDEINENAERNPAYPPLPDDVDVILNEQNEEDLDSYKTSHIDHGVPSNNPLINAKAALPLSLLKTHAPTDFVDEITDEEISSSTAVNEISTKSDDSKILLTSDIFDILNYIGNTTNNDQNEENKTQFDISTQDYSDFASTASSNSDISSFDGISTKNSLLETITTENTLLKSKETVEEDEDSGERVTEKTQLSSFMSYEDASMMHHNPDSAVSSDVELLVTQGPNTSSNDENSASEQKSVEVSSNNSYELKDVEMLETSNTSSTDLVTKSYEAIQNGSDENTDDGSLNNSSQIVSSSEDGLSAENGTQSSVEVVPYRTSQENELLMKVSDAISKFKLHESTDSLDINVLNILKDFLDKQAKSFK